MNNKAREQEQLAILTNQWEKQCQTLRVQQKTFQGNIRMTQYAQHGQPTCHSLLTRLQAHEKKVKASEGMTGGGRCLPPPPL